MCGARTRVSGTPTSTLAQAVGDPLGQHREPRDDGGGAPLRHHLHADRGHLQRDEVVALAHVEAPRTVDIARVGEVGVARRAPSAGRSSSAPAARRPGGAWRRTGRRDRRGRSATCRSGTPRSPDRACAHRAAARRRCAWRRRAAPHPAISALAPPCQDRPCRHPTSAPRRSRPARPAPRRAARSPSSSASVQSPLAGRGTVSTVKPCASARVIHSSTGEEWSSSQHQHA